MIYIKENEDIGVYFQFKGEDYQVSVISIDENGIYELTDLLFANERILTNRDLDALKLDLEHFYSSNDSIGRIEGKYIYDD